MIDLSTLSLCCAPVGLNVVTTSPRRELKSKLQQWLKHWKPFIECEDTIDVLNGLNGYATNSLTEQTNLALELDDIAFCVNSGIISGYIQFKIGFLREVFDWVKEHATLWLIDSYGPVYFGTNSTITSHHTIKGWQAIIHTTVECIFYTLAVPYRAQQFGARQLTYPA